MNCLLTGDLHLNDSPKDDYRFGLFKWLAQKQRELKTDATFILGDLTEKKDKHSAKLVNRIIDELITLKPPVYILRGNHDGYDPENPFFKFMNCIDGVHFIVKPVWHLIEGTDVTFIPHCRTQAEFDAGCQVLPSGSGHLMVHQTFDGTVSETGRRLSGLSASLIEKRVGLRVWAGDVHKPHQCGAVRYLGAPFHVRFGDDYTPRVIHFSHKGERDLHYPAPRKWSVTITDPLDLILLQTDEGDQIKITMKLKREEVISWPLFKEDCIEQCKELGLECYGIKLEAPEAARRIGVDAEKTITKDVFGEYCRIEKLGTAVREAGKIFL